MVLTEAQQFGVVPIAFKSYKSINDIIENNKNGILIEPFSVDDYAESFLKLMKDSKFRTKLATNLISTAKRFSLENIGSE